MQRHHSTLNALPLLITSMISILSVIAPQDLIHMALEYPKIDVHAHYLPEVYREYYLKYGPTTPDGMPGWWDWDADDHLKMADSLNITKSYLSVTSPGVRLVPGDDELARDLARKVNVAGAEVKRAHPDRFGLFLSLPLPDVESSLGELAYGMDHLDADGVVVLTNGDGYYLGHQRYEPLWAELDRRAAVVFIHPTTGRIVESTVDSPEGNSSRPVAPLPEYANPIFEFFFDTTRAVINLFYTGAIARYPNIKYIVAHAGACLPPLIQRFAELARIHQPMTVDASVSPDFVKERLRRQFFFDLAGFPFPDQLRGLLPFVGADQILYGTDYSPATADEVRRLAGIMAEYLPVIFNKEEQEMVYSKNAERLFQK